jgi:hypothetical protein
MNDRYSPLTDSERAATALHLSRQVEPAAAEPMLPPADAEPAEVAAVRLFGREPDALWRYTNAEGQTAFCVLRYSEADGRKSVLPLCWFAKGWRSKHWPAPRPLYNLDKIVARPDAPIIVCEGEKAGDAAVLVFPKSIATTSSGGSNAAAKTDWTPLAGRCVCVWPDNDEAGARYAREVAAILAALECDVSIVDAAILAGIDGGARGATHNPDGWDAADAVVEWTDLAALRTKVMDLAKPAPAPAQNGGDLDAEREAVARLAEGDFSAFLARANADPGFPFEPLVIAALNSFARNRAPDFERLRARLKAETKVRLAPLEAAMKVEDAEVGAGDGMAGRPISYDEIKPWEEAVNGADLLSELSGAIGAYVIMDKPQRDAVALWAVFAHAHDLRDYAPFLIIVSPLKRCGKTKLQETLARLTPRPQPTSGISAALFARLMEKHRPTLFIDEYDTIARGDREVAAALRGQLNSSFNKRSAVVLRLVPSQNEGWQERLFSTWAPTCVAGIGTVPDTVEDRSVMIRLARKLRAEAVMRLRGRDGSDLAILARKIARFVNDNEHAVRVVEPTAPDALNDRQADAWDPLFAIADVAGGEWPKRTREAALTLCRVDEAEAAERDIKIMLLTDIRDIFAKVCPEDDPAHEPERTGRADDGPRLLTKRLLDELHKLEERLWDAWGQAKKPMTGTDLASLLRPYRIRSDTVRGEDAMGNPVRGKGYYLRSFKDAFSRYLPVSGPSGRDTVTNSENAGETEVFGDVTNANCHGSQNAGNTSKSGLCHGVTASKGRTEGEDDKGRDDGALHGHGSTDGHETAEPHSDNLLENSHKSVKPPRWSLEL